MALNFSDEQSLSTEAVMHQLTLSPRIKIDNVNDLREEKKKFWQPSLYSNRLLQFSEKFLLQHNKWAAKVKNFAELALLLQRLTGLPEQQQKIYRQCKHLLIHSAGVSGLISILTALGQNEKLKEEVLEDYKSGVVSWADSFDDVDDLISLLGELNNCPRQQSKIYYQFYRLINDSSELIRLIKAIHGNCELKRAILTNFRLKYKSWYDYIDRPIDLPFLLREFKGNHENQQVMIDVLGSEVKDRKTLQQALSWLPTERMKESLLKKYFDQEENLSSLKEDCDYLVAAGISAKLLFAVIVELTPTIPCQILKEFIIQAKKEDKKFEDGVDRYGCDDNGLAMLLYQLLLQQNLADGYKQTIKSLVDPCQKADDNFNDDHNSYFPAHIVLWQKISSSPRKKSIETVDDKTNANQQETVFAI